MKLVKHPVYLYSLLRWHDSENAAAEEKKFTGWRMNFRSLRTGHSAMITVLKELAKMLLNFSGNVQ